MLWRRGLLPWRLIYGHLEMGDPGETGEGQPGEAQEATIWTDGHGTDPKDFRKRLCAWAAVWSGGHIKGTLPGGQQTVYRAELHAVCRALEVIAADVRQVTIVSDCLGG